MNQHTAWYTFILVFPLLLITKEQLFSSSISAKMALAAVVWTPGTVSQQGLVGRCDPSGLGNKALVLSLLIPDQAPRPPPPTSVRPVTPLPRPSAPTASLPLPSAPLGPSHFRPPCLRHSHFRLLPVLCVSDSNGPSRQC